MSVSRELCWSCALGAFLVAGGGTWFLLGGAEANPGRAEGEAERLSAVVDIERAPPAWRETAGERVDLRVTVTLGGGPAPEGTVVRLLDHGPGCGTSRHRRAAKASPGPDGAVVFRGAFPGGYTLHVTAPGLPILTERVQLPQGREARIDFPAGGEVAGRVVDERGQPVPGARVYLFTRQGTLENQSSVSVEDTHGRPAYAQRSHRVGEDGCFTFRGLPAGPVALAADGFDSLLGQAVRVEVGARDARIPVPVAGRIAGRVELPAEIAQGAVPLRLEARFEGRKTDFAARARARSRTPVATFEQLFEPAALEGWAGAYSKYVDLGADGRFELFLPLRGAYELRAYRSGCRGPWVKAGLGDQDVLVPAPSCPPEEP